MEISLSGCKWQVKGYWPYVPLKEKSMETGQTLHGVTDWIDAQVPGSVHVDLFRAGLIEDPYFAKNSLHCEWVENRWWMYRTVFPAVLNGVDLRGQHVELVCKGLDYEAEVFCNDVSCGSHIGMYDAFRVDVTSLLQEENKLVVLFKGVPAEMGQIGYTFRTSTQKSRFNYKWDFSTRLVNIGFWQDVVLSVQEEAAFENVHLDTDYQGRQGRILFAADIADHRNVQTAKLTCKITAAGPFDRRSQDKRLLEALEQEGSLRQSGMPETGKGQETGARQPQTADWSASKPETFVWEGEVPSQGGKARIDAALLVQDPILWQPNGSGIPWLYAGNAQIWEGDRLLCTYPFQTGIRTLRLDANEGAPKDALPYTFVVNEVKTYIKGVNMTPLDHVYGAVDAKRYRYLVTAMAHAGVNLVRVWGGGLIEKEVFYDLCDENGILVWQEFIQSSSGIDNRPGEDPAFLRLLETAATAAVREKRNHVCLAVYSGGNELMDGENRPSGYGNQNLAMLKSIVEKEDGRRVFLPTSASGPREFVTKEKGVSHDVHGSWSYGGNPGHYELYGESDSLFHSEFGMDGVSCKKSLQKFLPVPSLRPTPMSGDPNWQHHGEWWGTYFRDCGMFGPIEKTPGKLETFVRCSQYMQSEGLRFILEADRRRAFANSGTIIWQFNEPWPNSSCTNLVDYYGETKSAYYQARRAYENRHISIDYRSLTYRAGERVSFPVYVENSGAFLEGRVCMTARNLAGDVLAQTEYAAHVLDKRSTKTGEFSFVVPREDVFFVTAMLWEGEMVLSENTYLFSTCEKEPFAALCKKQGQVVLTAQAVSALPDGRFRARLSLKNTGDRAVMEAGVWLEGDSHCLLGSDNYVTLFPGQERELSFLLIPYAAGPFEIEKYDGSVTAPKFMVRWL